MEEFCFVREALKECCRLEREARKIKIKLKRIRNEKKELKIFVDNLSKIYLEREGIFLDEEELNELSERLQDENLRKIEYLPQKLSCRGVFDWYNLLIIENHPNGRGKTYQLDDQIPAEYFVDKGINFKDA